MRILLATNACYMPTRGGSTRSNRVWLERLAAHGTNAESSARQRKRTRISSYVIQRRGSGANVPERRVAEHRGLRRHKLAWSICAEGSRPSPNVEQLKRNILDFVPDWIFDLFRGSWSGTASRGPSNRAR